MKILKYLLIFANIVFAQVSFDDLSTINEDTTIYISVANNLQPLIFEVTMDTIEWSFQKEIYPKYFIEIFDSNKSQPIQKIVDSIQNAFYHMGIKFFDINTDEYLDLAVIHDISNRWDPIYNFYLYDKNLNIFRYNEKYSQLCCYWLVDTVKNEIEDYYFNEITKSLTTVFYKLLPEEPLLYKMIKTRSLEEYSKASTVVKEYGLVNGELVIVKDSVRTSIEGW